MREQFRYVCVGTLDDPEELPPKGEFFCMNRDSWIPEIPSRLLFLSMLIMLVILTRLYLDVFHKQQIKE